MKCPNSELSSLRKLQSFVNHHEIQESRYLSSPNLFGFNSTSSTSDLDEKYKNRYATYLEGSDIGIPESDEDEFVDVETIHRNICSSKRNKVINTLNGI